MRIDTITVRNFKGFIDHTYELAPSFNLFVGPNGAGKTSILDALAVAAASWLIGFPGYDSRRIRAEDVHLQPQEFDGDIRFEEQYPVEVTATGEVMGEAIRWSRTLRGPKGRTTTGDAADLRRLASSAAKAVRSGSGATIPLISYYGTGRLWLEPRQRTRVANPDKLSNQKRLSRLEGYRNSVDPRLTTHELVEWIARQAWVEYQQGREQSVYGVVRRAILGCIEGAKHLYFDPRRGEVIVVFQNHGGQPFANLSDGQKTMLALVGDVAQKAVQLNPHLADRALEETPGVVLVDELEMHIHPSWQRRIERDLRQTFPRIQFICTTHAPQIIGQARNSEVVLLDSGTHPHPAAAYGLSSDEVLESVQGAKRRDPGISQQAEQIIALLEDLEPERADAMIDQLRSQVDLPSPLLSELETKANNVRALLSDAAAEAAR